MKPSITHIIGISNIDKIKFKNQIDAFLEKNSEKDLLTMSKELNIQNEHIEITLKNKFVFDLIQNFEKGSNKIFGMRPISNFKDSNLYDSDLLWSLLETRMLDANPKCLKIPYKDISDYKELSSSEVYDLIDDKKLAREIIAYNGDWNRLYGNFNIYKFDEDFDFALEFFSKIGIEIEKKQLDRYLIFEWS